MQPGNVNLHRADFFLEIKIGEFPRNGLRNGNGTRRCQRAIVHARAGDDITREAIVCRGQANRNKRLPQGKRIILLHMGKNDVLRVADTQFIMGIALGQIRHHAHLLRRGIARNAAFGLQGNIDDGVAINPVRRQIVARPAGKFRIGKFCFLKGRRKA